ncbi:hypothetical protein [Spongiivirga citrea]|uniref:Uncharacterized protein n=1 Tax=Spongiivirga citrea TaxID=1481457 RepID=A0A6M0CGF3_9FLAO|nr:hypothetical protein [Spongiivirga citrea]NER16968.1 hypothetical protein [Spongiivirga citrea]
MRCTKQIKRGLIYFVIALVLSVANIALNSSETEMDNATDTQFSVAVTQPANFK